MVDKALDGQGRPLTRRELRELSTGGTEPGSSDDVASDDVASDDTGQDDVLSDDTGQDDVQQDDDVPQDDALPDDATRELPRAVPPGAQPAQGEQHDPDRPVPYGTDQPVPDGADQPVPDGADQPVPDGADQPVPDGTDQPVADGTDQPDGAWGQVVDWSLHQELPRELPPEPEVDDVRWDPVSSAMDDPQSALSGSFVPAGAWVPARPAEGAPARGPRDPGDQDPAGADEAVDGPTEAPEPSAATATGAPTGTPPRRTSALPVPPRSAEPSPEAFPPPPASSAPSAPGPGEPLPTLTDLLAARPAPPAGPAESGWQGTLRRLSGGLVSPAPGRAERQRRTAVATVQRSLDGPKTVVVINPKGGAHKTTATMMLASTFGMHRGGYTLAWDNNETRGTLGWRSHQSRHHNTAVNLLQDLDRFADPGSARVGDLDNYVRSQGSAQFDVLASDEDAASAASIDAFAFRSLHRTLSRFYRVMVVDTGNNMRASNWQAAIEAADQVVIVSTVREDTAQSAAWAVDALRATGHEDVVRRAVTVLSAPAAQVDDRLADRLHEHFGRLTRAVLDVPYDPSLVAGRPLEYDALSSSTRDAWLHVTAAVAEGL